MGLIARGDRAISTYNYQPGAVDGCGTVTMMNSVGALGDMDPAARAVAEVRAREAGMSLSEWLGALVYEHAAPSVVRRHYWHGGGLFAGSEIAPVHSRAVGAAVRPDPGYDLEAAGYITGFSLPPALTTNFDNIVSAPDIREMTPSALRIIAAFPPRISHAAILLSAAFAEAHVQDFRLPLHRPGPRAKGGERWYDALVEISLHRSREVRNALVHHWNPTERAERLWSDAFQTLCELSPARHELLVLFNHDRAKASVELARHVDVATQQFELSARLIAELETDVVASTEDDRFAAIRKTLLERAGGGLSLTEGARVLGITRQALHKRIKAATALGMMDGNELVLPRLQWDTTGKEVKFVPGIADIVKLFKRAGGWSALQFLLDPDPNLRRAPIDALRAGDVEPAIAAARAYLGLDEE